MAIRKETARKLLMIGVDAADLGLIRRWMDEGRLPALSALRQGGHFAELNSPANHYAGGVWPSFYLSQSVAEHGLYHNKLWHPERMRIEVPTSAWLKSEPFVCHLDGLGKRVCVVDLPMLIEDPKLDHGVYLGGWGTHDLIARGSQPPSLWPELVKEFGKPVMPAEHFGHQDGEALLHLREALLKATEQSGKVARRLLSHRDWDLGLIVFGATHRAGHYLWDLSEMGGDLGDGQRVLLEGALAEVYSAVDREIAQLVEAQPPDCAMFVFAVHGMTANPGWADYLPDIIDRIELARLGTRPKRGLLYSIKRRLPIEWIRPVLESLPPAASARLVSLWSSRMMDWSATRHFGVPMDHAGFIRLNVKGREKEGVIEPGDAYDAHLDQLTQIMRSLKDAATGRPIVSDVIHACKMAPPDAAARDLLPDLVVVWADQPASSTGRLVSDLLPDFSFDVARPAPSGRSGNHNGDGWMIAAGPGIPKGSGSVGHDIIDIVPTAMQFLHVEAAPDWQGRPIDLWAGDSAP